MNPLKSTYFIVSGLLWLSLASCGNKNKTETTAFTRTDSLTEIYLTLQDGLLDSWNTMIQDDNHKIKIMKNLFHELQVCGQFDPEILKGLQQRLEQLQHIRYSAKTMWNADIIEEYDFASQSLVTELITLAESHKGYAYNKSLQSMVDDIRSADMRVENYRMDYDSIATRFNQFLDENNDQLREIAEDGNLTKKPLFQIVSE